MKEEIIKSFTDSICNDFKDIIMVGLEENKEEMPYSITCINFIYELKEKGINVTIDYFSEDLRNQVYNEIKKYLVR